MLADLLEHNGFAGSQEQPIYSMELQLIYFYVAAHVLLAIF